jgi:hypothetical protein
MAGDVVKMRLRAPHPSVGHEEYATSVLEQTRLLYVCHRRLREETAVADTCRDTMEKEEVKADLVRWHLRSSSVVD